MLEVNNLSISFIQYQAGLRQQNLRVIADLSINIEAGKILAVVGSSGSGKSLLAHAILGILPKNAVVSGSMVYKGTELIPKLQKKLRGREIALIPQSVNFLDPLMNIGEQVRYSVHGSNAREKQKDIFKRYSLDEAAEKKYPFQLSGGMARRALVATAVVGGAELIIADEPTPGLHPDIVRETLGHLRELADRGCGVMLITHDISTALEVADNIAVFYSGTTVETAPSSDFAGEGGALRHPYTKALWNALPQNAFQPVDGFQPSHSVVHTGCLFEKRCREKSETCKINSPELRELRYGTVRCHNAT